MYGYGIEGEMVESFKEVHKLGGSEKTSGWDEALQDLEREGWLVY